MVNTRKLIDTFFDNMTSEICEMLRSKNNVAHVSKRLKRSYLRTTLKEMFGKDNVYIYAKSVFVFIQNRGDVGVSDFKFGDDFQLSFDLWFAVSGLSDREGILYSKRFEGKVLSTTDLLLEFFKYIHNNYELKIQELKMVLAKEQKNFEIARSSIYTIIPKFMEQTKFEWNIDDGDDCFLLQIKMQMENMMEISLDFRTFTDKISEFKRVIAQSKGVNDFFNKVPYPVSIKSSGCYIHWKKDGK